MCIRDRYLIFLSDEGRVNSYVGVEMVGKGIIITTLQLKLFIVVFKQFIRLYILKYLNYQ